MTLLNARLRDELSAVCPPDDRTPLPRRLRPVDDTDNSERSGAGRVLAILRGGVELQAGQIAARLLIREEDVTRSLLVLRLAEKVVKLRGERGKHERWKAITSGEEGIA